jgi:hypothetical protein
MKMKKGIPKARGVKNEMLELSDRLKVSISKILYEMIHEIIHNISSK